MKTFEADWGACAPGGESGACLIMTALPVRWERRRNFNQLWNYGKIKLVRRVSVKFTFAKVVGRTVLLAVWMAVGCGGITAPGTPVGSGRFSCDPGWCLNYFSGSDSGVCCREAYKYYCDGTDKCYQTFSDAYWGQNCTLPAERRCY